MIAVTLIEIPSWDTMTLIEAVWLLSGLTALLFTGMHLLPLHMDWQAAIKSKQPALRAVAVGYFRREIIRFLQGMCIAGVGIYASLEPPVIPGPVRTSILGLAVTGVLLFLAVLVTIQSAWDWRTREEVEHFLNYQVATDNAVLLVDAAGKIKYSNNVADKVFGRRLVGVDVEELIPERLRVAHREHRAEYIKDPTARPMGLHLGTVGLRPDGSEFPIYATLSSFTDEVGDTYTMVTAKLAPDLEEE